MELKKGWFIKNNIEKTVKNLIRTMDRRYLDVLEKAMHIKFAESVLDELNMIPIYTTEEEMKKVTSATENQIVDIIRGKGAIEAAAARVVIAIEIEVVYVY